MGRAPLDDETRRYIEESHPEVEFDWGRIVTGQAGPECEAPDSSTGPRDSAPRSQQNRRQAARTPPRAPRLPAADTVPPAIDAVADRSAGPDVGAVETRLGQQGVTRLRGRYREMLSRIAHRVPEPERQQELNALAERLNPDTWLTDADVTFRLEAYEETFDALRRALGPRPDRAETVEPPLETAPAESGE